MEDKTKTIDRLMGILVCATLVIAPLVIDKAAYYYTDTPQRAIIQITAGVLLLLCFLKMTLAGKGSLGNETLKYPLILFLVWAAASLSWSVNTYIAFERLLHWISCFIIYFVIATQLREAHFTESVIRSLIFSTLVMCFIGFLQYLAGLDWFPQAETPGATLGRTNFAAQVVAMIFPMGLPLFFSRKKWAPFFSDSLIFFGFTFIIYTNVRAAWVAMGLSFCFFIWMVIRDRRLESSLMTFNKARLYRMAILVLLILIFTNLTSQGFKWQVGRIYNRSADIVKDPGASSMGRLAYWRNCLEMIADKPFTGFGLDNLKIHYPKYLEAAAERRIPIGHRLGRAHNDYIQTAVELGIPGLLLFIGLFGMAFKVGFRASSADVDPEGRIRVISILAAILGFMTVAFFCFPMYKTVPPLYLFALFGLLTRLDSGAGGVPETRFYTFPVSKKAAPLLILSGLAALVFVSLFNWYNIKGQRHYNLAEAFGDQGDFEQALAHLLIAHEKTPGMYGVQSGIAACYMEKGEYRKGIEYVKAHLENEPFHRKGWFNLMSAYRASGDLDSALKTYQYLIKLDPKYSEAHLEGGRIYLDKGETHKAIDCFQTAISHKTCYEEALYYSAIAYKLAGDMERAIRQFESILGSNPRKSEIHVVLSQLYEERNDCETACSHARSYLEQTVHKAFKDQMKALIARLGDCDRRNGNK